MSSIIEKLEKENNIVYSDEQKKILEHKGGMCILACAGSGKTTVLTHLILKRIMTGEINPDKLLCTTYSKAGALELEVRLKKLLEKNGLNSNNVSIKTMHASYYQVLKKFGYINKVNNNSRMKYIIEICRELKLRLENEELESLESLLSYQVNNLLSDGDLVKSYVYTLDTVSLEQYTAIRNGVNRKKKENNEVDFDDLQLFMYMLLVKNNNQDILNYCNNIWEYFYIDESQDISKIQFEILRAIAKDYNKLVMIGDDDQSIYTWRGADPNILLNICGYYDIDKFILSTNYRCKSNIVNPASVGIVNNARRENKTMIPYREGGKIQLVDSGYKDIFKISTMVYEHISNLIKNGVNPKDIAVMARNNQHLSLLNSMLFKNGIYTVCAKGMKLSKSTMYADMKDLIEILDNTFSPFVVERILWKLIPYFSTQKAKVISKFMETTGLNIVDSLRYLISKFSSHKLPEIFFDRKLNIPDRYIEKLSYQYMNFSTDNDICLNALCYILLNVNKVERTEKLFNLYMESCGYLYNSEDRYRNLSGLLNYVLYMIKEDGYENTMDYLTTVEQFDSGTLNVNNDKVNLTTLHGSKGREWEHVIIMADDNVTFPSFEGINNMLNKGISDEDISNSIDEGRRLHYVAMTRAKENLTIFTSKDNMGIYLLESLGLVKKREDDKLNAHVIELANKGIGENLKNEIKKLFEERKV